MRIADCCNRNVVTATRDTGVEEAARLMRAHHVGTLVVVGGGPGPRHPVGVVTDRDLVLELLAGNIPAAELTLADVMNHDLVTAGVDDGLWETLERMTARGVRRLPVVTRDNVLEGILSIDDIARVLVSAQSRLMQLIDNEMATEHRMRPSDPPLPVSADSAGSAFGPVAEWACGDGLERRVARLSLRRANGQSPASQGVAPAAAGV